MENLKSFMRVKEKTTIYSAGSAITVNRPALSDNVLFRNTKPNLESQLNLYLNHILLKKILIILQIIIKKS